MIKMRGLVLGTILLVLFVPFVLSFTDSNFAYRSGGFSSQGYLGSQGYNLYGMERDEVCSSGKDFVVQVAPFGCTPAVVRSDLLEEQNVAVFCPLIASQLNPLIEIERIDSVSFSGRNYSEQISGIGFHPTRAALSFSGSSPIGQPIANDIGYVVIVLKQEPKEANMPDFVNGTLVANLRYKMSDVGVGSATYYIPEMDNAEWGDNFNKYGFWGDKGYIRVDGIGDNSATVSVYSGGGSSDKIRSFTLAKGQTSDEVYVPGFYCQAGASFRLDDLVNPDVRARLSVSGEIVEVKVGEKFLDNKCVVKKLDVQGLLQSVIISCEGDNAVSNFKLSRSPEMKIIVDGESINAGVGDRLFETESGEGVYLADVKYSKDSGRQDDLEISLFVSPSGLDKLPEINDKMRLSSTAIKYNSEIEYSGKKIVLTGFADGKNEDFSEYAANVNFEKYFSGALDDYDNVLGNFGGERKLDTGDVENSYGYEALVKAIKLASWTDQREDAIVLCNKFAELYPGKSLEECSNKERFSNSGTSVYGINVNGRFKEISFLEIKEPTFSEYGVRLNVGGNVVELSRLEKKSIGSGEYVQLISLTESGAKLNVGLKPAEGDKFIEKAVTLNVNDVQTFGSNYNFGISDINLEKVAKISLIPGIKVDGTSTNFSFQIGIEKRAIQLSPEKTQARIDKLNETIEKWTELSENLGEVVKGFRGACIATGAVLTVKNLFSGMGGTAIARADVNEYWKAECKDSEYNGEVYNSVDHCFLENSDAIEAAIKARADVIKIQNQKEINNDNRRDRFKEIAGKLDGKEFANPDGSEGNLVVGEDFEVDKLLEESDGGYLMSDREMRDIEMELLILEKDPNNFIARQKFDKYMGDFYVNNKLDVKARSVAEGYKIDSKFVSVSNEGVKEEIQTDDYLSSGSFGVCGDIPFARIYIDASSGTEYLLCHSTEGVVKKTFKKEGEAWKDAGTDKNGINPLGVKVTKYDSSSYKNKYKNPELTYFETAPYKGFPALVPIDSRNGWYAAMKQKTGAIGGIASYEDSGAVSSFSLCNVGANGREEFNTGLGDDECRVFNPGTGSIYGTFPGLTKAETDSLVRCAMNAVESAESKYKSGVSSVSISSCSGGSETFKVGNPAVNLPAVQCQDFMSAKDCHILFNVCDPVICPSSRCDFGGTYPVDNVVASGIIGSIALCLPNYKEKILIPVCLTGIQAGIDGLISVFQNYQDCLQNNLETGEMTGICDEIHSIYLCEFFWRQAIPLMNMGVPKILSALMGEGTRGGGEYSTIQAAWDNANAGVGYMTNYYGANAMAAFNAKSTEEVGGSFCKSFASINYPNSGGGFLDALLEPESPSQYHAWFSEIPFSTATVPATSQYKVFYHIFAGKDQGSYYNVYLSNPTGGSYFQSTGRLVVASGYIKRGDYASETRDLTAPAGYNELCISVNGKDECGFKQVSTSFAINYMNDKFIEEQATKENINSERECVSGSASAYSLLQPNVQEGVDDVINPQLYNRGIVRVCSTSNPGEGTDPSWNVANASRWRQVGYCDSEKMGCWIDTESVEGVIQSTAIEDAVIGDVTDAYMKMLGEQDYLDMDEKKFNDFINELSGMDKLQVIVEIDSSLLSKVLINNNKAKLLMIRAGAYDGLAREARTAIAIERVENEADEILDYIEGGEVSEGERDDKNCGELGGVFQNVSCPDGYEDISDEVTDVTDKKVLSDYYLCCKKVEEDGVVSSVDINRKIFTEAEVINAIKKSDKVSDKCLDYVKLVMKYSEKEQVDPLLVFALIQQESGCEMIKTPNNVGAVGLMQIYSFDMCKAIGTKSEISSNLDKNIGCGISILRQKYDKNKCHIGMSYSCNSFTFGADASGGYAGKTEPSIDAKYNNWACALRYYNGDGCAGKKSDGSYIYADNGFVEDVNTKYESLLNT